MTRFSYLLIPVTMGAVFQASLAPAQAGCIETVSRLLETSTYVISPRADAFLETLSKPVVLQGPKPSAAIKRIGIILEATGSITAQLEASDPSGMTLRITPGKGGVSTYDKIDYIEFPNSTQAKTTDPKTGKERRWILARGVRKYSTLVDLKTGKQSPDKYLSDVLLFEFKDGKAHYRSRLITSIEASKFFFEDPRISPLTEPDGSERNILSGTDYSPHLPGATDPDVMNRYVELELDHRGVPKALKLDKAGRPDFSNVSPFPKKIGNDVISVDAKNATFAYNELNQLVVRTRLRPDFSLPAIREMAGSDHWKYAEQVFVFKDWAEMKRYNWDNCLVDLFGKSDPNEAPRVKPLLAKTILRDSQLKELFTDSRIVAAKGKGMGPGTPPIRLVRRGNKLFVSAGKNAKEQLAGNLDNDFYLKPNDPKYLTFDHEIRYFMDSRKGFDFLKRHYSMPVKLFDSTLTKIESYYADTLQPENAHELGHRTGIVDLQHAYPMGWDIVVDPDGVARVYVSLGISDAHTMIVRVDLVTLLKEMAPDSERVKAGQIYGIE